MDSIQTIYDHLWKQTLKQFQLGICSLDSQIDNPKDSRRGITLRICLPEEISQQISSFLTILTTLEPDQYYYPNSDLHITVLSIINCHDSFSLEQIHVPDYANLLTPLLKTIPPFTIHFQGITASPSCIMLQGFPINNQLNQLRHQLRTHFKHSNLQHTIDQRYVIQAAHSTLVRFRTPLKYPQQFLEYLQQYRETEFSSFRVERMELVYNDWYQKNETVQILKTFELHS